MYDNRVSDVDLFNIVKKINDLNKIINKIINNYYITCLFVPMTTRYSLRTLNIMYKKNFDLLYISTYNHF